MSLPAWTSPLGPASQVRLSSRPLALPTPAHISAMVHRAYALPSVRAPVTVLTGLQCVGP
eukprot:54940-Eustigmatos_ZCMA.PRE.1